VHFHNPPERQGVLTVITAVFVPASTDVPITWREVSPIDPDRYASLVGGKAFAIPLRQPDAQLYVNAERLSNLMLPVNPRATALNWLHNGELRGYEVIVGDAVLVGPSTDAGDESAPTSLMHLLFASTRFGMEVRVESEGTWKRSPGIWSDWLEPYVTAAGLMRRHVFFEARVVAVE
jgi:hypothetical protein